MKNNNEVGLICEQGDLGLFFDPLSESDKALYEKQLRKEKEEKKSSKK